MTRIPDQVNLPLEIAARIVMQGLRIRLGRSMITVSGVLLGIMFLSSTMTTHLVKSGVAEEDALRAEVSRMGNFLGAELGVLRDKTVCIIAEGDLSESERRLVRQLQREGVARIDWFGELPPALRTIRILHEAPDSAFPTDCDGVVMMGASSPLPISLARLAEAGFMRTVAMTRLERQQTAAIENLHAVSLSGQLTAEELQREEAEATTARYRLIWIMVIALAVTMMGITNAMLMSVTERFREIGTMKCLGATSQLIRRIFLIESLLIGGTGGIAGALLGALFSIVFHGVVYGFGMVFASLSMGPLLLIMAASAAGGILLTILAAIYPAGVASSMVPADALRSNV